jgi:predicted enzyme related to lactoylglutathione lyase
MKDDMKSMGAEGRVAHFDLYANDPNRAADFYGKTLGWKFSKWEGPMNYWLIETGKEMSPGINGGMALREGEWGKMGCSSGAVTVQVEDLDGTLEKVKENGGEVVMEKAPIPGVGWMANFKDTEGNILGLMKEDLSAK